MITEYMGGGFGSKFGPDAQGVICAKLAKQAGAPVKLMLDRKEEHLAGGNRPSSSSKIKAGVAADGTSWRSTPKPRAPAAPASAPASRCRTSTRFRTGADATRTSTRTPGRRARCARPAIRRGASTPRLLMDELADKVRMDPLAFRMKNLPPEAPNAMWRKYFPIAAEQFGWSKRTPDRRSDARADQARHGLRGQPVGRRRARHEGALRDPAGWQRRRALRHAGHRRRHEDHRHDDRGRNAGRALSAVKAEIGDSRYPFSGGSGGSTTAPSVSPAIRVTAGKALDALKARIAPALGVEPADLVAATGGSRRRRIRPRASTWKDACRKLGTEPVAVDGEWEAGLSASGTSGVQFAEVEVDIETGVTKVTRMTCVQDCGLVLDELTAESQCIGGIIMGVNYALFEDRILDRVTGHMVNPNMEWYQLAGMSDIPKIEVKLMNQPERGVIGIGEPPTISTAAAIANAVDNAIGVRVRSMPITPERILDAIATRGTREGRCEGLCLRQCAATRRRRVAALVDRARQDAAARRRHGPDRADEGLRRAARRPREREEASLRDRGRRAGADLDRGGGARRGRRRARGAREGVPRAHRRRGEVGTPQIRNLGTVGGNLMQRPRCWYFRNEEFHCLKKGGARCFAVDGENQFHAIFGDGPCHIVHPSSLAVPLIAYGGRFRVVGPAGRAGDRGGQVLPHARSQHVRRNRPRAERARDGRASCRGSRT